MGAIWRRTGKAIKLITQSYIMQISKTRKTIGWVLSGFTALILIRSSIMKILNAPETAEGLGAINITNPPLLGGIELACVALYLIPKTSNIGFFLLCSYLGGAIAASIAQGHLPTTGIVFSVLLYVGTMLRKPELSGLNI